MKFIIKKTKKGITRNLGKRFKYLVEKYAIVWNSS